MDRAKTVAWFRARAPHFALELGINVAVPLLIYDQVHGTMGEVQALLVSSIPPFVWGIGRFLRERRIDALSILAMVGIALSLLAFFGGRSAQMLQLREKMVTLLIGLAFLGSAAIGKPLIMPLARATLARESDEALADFDARHDHPMLRRTVMVMTLAWGVVLLLDVAVSIVLIFSLSIEQYLIVGPILGYGTIGGLSWWTILYRRHRTRLRHAEATSNQVPGRSLWNRIRLHRLDSGVRRPRGHQSPVRKRNAPRCGCGGARRVFARRHFSLEPIAGARILPIEIGSLPPALPVSFRDPAPHLPPPKGVRRGSHFRASARLSRIQTLHFGDTSVAIARRGMEPFMSAVIGAAHASFRSARFRTFFLA